MTVASLGALSSRIDSGFYESQGDGTNWPNSDTGWKHLIASTHSYGGNYFSLQLSGPFGDQELYLRKTNNNTAQAWSRFWTSNNFDPNSKANVNSPTFTGVVAVSGTDNNTRAWMRGSDGYMRSSWHAFDAGTGLYTPETGHYFYPSSAGNGSEWYIRSAVNAGDIARLWFQRGDTSGNLGAITFQGNGNNIGFLNSAGNWRLQTIQNGFTFLHSNASGVARTVFSVSDSEYGWALDATVGRGDVSLNTLTGVYRTVWNSVSDRTQNTPASVGNYGWIMNMTDSIGSWGPQLWFADWQEDSRQVWMRMRRGASFGTWANFMMGTVNLWHRDSEGVNRYYFVNGAQTLFGSPSGFEFRHSDDLRHTLVRRDGIHLISRQEATGDAGIYYYNSSEAQLWHEGTIWNATNDWGLWSTHVGSILRIQRETGRWDFWSYTDQIFNFNSASGSLSIGSLNTGYCHFLTDRPIFYFNKDVDVDGVLQRHLWTASDRGGYWFDTSGNGALRGTSPTLYFRDRDNVRTAAIHFNGNVFHILRHGSQDVNSWDSGPNGRHPMILNMDNGDVTFSGNVIAFSDVRLKSAIEDLSSARYILESLRPRQYIMDGSWKFGFVAQEAVSVVPSIVSVIGNSDILGIDYGRLVAPLVAGWQDHEAEIQQLKNENEELKRKIEVIIEKLGIAI